MTGTGADGCGDHYSRLLRDLCALLATVVCPHPAAATAPRMSPAAAASMLLGASVALMLCGSVTFAIGLLLVPWVAGLALLFALAAAVSTLSSGVFFSAAKPRARMCAPPIGTEMLVP